MIDGLELLPGLAGLSKERIYSTRENCLAKVRELTAPLMEDEGRSRSFPSACSVQSTEVSFGIGPFVLPKGPMPNDPNSLPFAMQAPTTLDNLLRVLRACQLPKSILLEGSPGVGKTTLVQALADASGRTLCRINLSEQTDLIDLFGSDLPVAGGQAGEFAWQDAAFLTAMKNGHWVLLDEMNLASQAILEGLNAVLDHRGSVFIPELGRTFDKHPDFRIFAAQNPVQQGGGRKGLPKSFLNRFTKVYVQEHKRSDLQVICRHLYPGVPADIIDAVIEFSSRLQGAVMQDRSFGHDGSPWEFNLRDIMRCFRLMLAPTGLEVGSSLEDALTIVYVRRFRTKTDQSAVSQLLKEVLQTTIRHDAQPWPRITTSDLAVGHAKAHRHSSSMWPVRRLETSHQTLQPQEALLRSVSAGWLTILVGSSATGKRSLVRQSAQILGTTLAEYSMHPAVDTMEMLGSFEQTDRNRHLGDLFAIILARCERDHRDSQIGQAHLEDAVNDLERFIRTPNDAVLQAVDASARQLLDSLADRLETEAKLALEQELDHLMKSSTTSSFEWIDGPLVKAIKNGGWYLINDANLCSSSVLDRLNSLCELNGTLILSERGNSHDGVEVIKPHPDFRLFMAFDPRNGELSRAMRNRGIEIGFTDGAVKASNRVDNGHLGSEYARIAHVESACVNELLGHGLLQVQAEKQAALLGHILASRSLTSVGRSFAILRVLVPLQPNIEEVMYHAVQEVSRLRLADAGIQSQDIEQLAKDFETALVSLSVNSADPPTSLTLAIRLQPMGVSTYPPLDRLDPHRIVTRVISMLIANGRLDVDSDLPRDDTGAHVVAFLQAARQEIALATPTILSRGPNTASVSDIKRWELDRADDRYHSAIKDCLESYLLLQDFTDIVSESLLATETTDVALVHSLLGELLKGFTVPSRNRALTSSLEALRRRANPSTGLAQTALWRTMRRPANFEEANSTVIEALSSHVQRELPLILRHLCRVIS